MSILQRSLVALAFTVLVVLIPSSQASACSPSDVLLPVESIRRTGGAVGESRCYRLDLHSAGLLHLDLSAIASAQARLELMPLAEGGNVSTSPRIAARSATELVAWVAPGAYTVEVVAEDPRRPLPAHRLTSRFLDLDKSENDGELELEPEKSENDGELELEPEKSENDGELELEPEKVEADPRACIPGQWSENDGELELEPEKGENDGELELEPEKSEDDGELELEPEKATVSCRIGPWLDALCRQAADSTDDHVDTLACASSLDQPVKGSLSNGWGDDVDTFRFQVDHWRTIELSAQGSVQGTLFDHRGQRLDTVGSSNHGFRLVRSLGPGTYYLRLTAEEDAGPYTLKLESIR